MKFNERKNKSNKKMHIVGSAIILLLAVIFCLYSFVFADNFNGFKTSTAEEQKAPFDDSPPTDEQKKTGDSIKEQTITKDRAESNSNTSPVNILITSPTSQTETSNSPNLILRTDVENIQTNEGSCSLRLTNGSTVVQRQVGVQALSSYSTCKGFDIPMSELSTGDWEATITIESGSAKATTSQKISIQRTQ